MKTIATFLCLCLALQSYAQSDTLYVGIGSNIAKNNENKGLLIALTTHLSQKLNRPVKVITDKTKAITDACQQGKIDIALLNTFGYVLGAETKAIEPLLVIADAQGKPIAYQSFIGAHPSTGIKTMEQLREKAGQYDFTFVNPASTSGHLIPRLHLDQIDLQPDLSFANIVYGDTHLQTLQKMASGEAKVGASSFTDYEVLVKEGKIGKDKINILWKSKPIVNGPIAVRKSLPEAQKKQIKEVFEKLPADNAPLQQKLRKIWHNTTEETTYVLAKDQFYDPIRKMADSVEELMIVMELQDE